MSDGAGLGLVERASDAAARGEWKQAFDLLMEADADGLLTAPSYPCSVRSPTRPAISM